MTEIEFLLRVKKHLQDELSVIGDRIATLKRQTVTTSTPPVIVGGMSSTLAVGPNDAEAAK